MSPKLLSRRTLLRGSLGGAAISLGLPPLEAMLNGNGAYADGSTDEPFFGVFFWANGLPWNAKHGAASTAFEDHWTPNTTGSGYEVSPLLAPLARHQISVATGLTPTTEIPLSPGGQGDGHMRGFMVSLTGDRPRSEGFNHAAHTLTALRPSIDQYVAHHPDFYQSTPRFRSLIAGASEARFHEYGHWNAVSYNGPNSLNLPIMQPQALFDYLFAIPPGVTESGRRAKALDAVFEDAQNLSSKLGTSDRQRIEQHMQHVFEIQQRLEATDPACVQPARPSNGGSLHSKAQTMGELLAVAVNCGLTRVFSFMLTSPATTHIFSNLGVSDGMHKTCHDGHWQRIYDITQHHMEAFALFLDAFAATSVASGGNLLEHGCILGLSEYGEGWNHGVAEMPALFAGGARGRISRGVHVRDPGASLSKAHLTVLQGLGLPETSFGFNGGETTDPLNGLLA